MKTKIAIFMTFVVTMALALAVAFSQEPMKARLVIVQRFDEKTSSTLAKITKTVTVGEAPSESDLIEVTLATNAAFVELHKEKAMNPRLAAYEGQWKNIRVYKGTEFGVRLGPFAESFVIAGKDGANKVSTCTVVVSATKGEGGVVRYAKAVDAAQGGAFKEFGIVTATKDIERAEYVFKVFRKNIETGSTKRIVCTDTKKPVVVTIPE